jgi:hypothetical protein
MRSRGGQLEVRGKADRWAQAVSGRRGREEGDGSAAVFGPEGGKVGCGVRRREAGPRGEGWAGKPKGRRRGLGRFCFFSNPFSNLFKLLNSFQTLFKFSNHFKNF